MKETFYRHFEGYVTIKVEREGSKSFSITTYKFDLELKRGIDSPIGKKEIGRERHNGSQASSKPNYKFHWVLRLKNHPLWLNTLLLELPPSTLEALKRQPSPLALCEAVPRKLLKKVTPTLRPSGMISTQREVGPSL